MEIKEEDIRFLVVINFLNLQSRYHIKKEVNKNKFIKISVKNTSVKSRFDKSFLSEDPPIKSLKQLVDFSKINKVNKFLTFSSISWLPWISNDSINGKNYNIYPDEINIPDASND